MGRFVEGDDDEARGLEVEPVDDHGACGVGVGEAGACFEGIGLGGVGLGGLPGDGGEPGGLVADNIRLVGVGDAELRARRE